MQVAATRISEVTVYRNGALVVREGAGRGDVEVRGLPLLFSADSLRVRPVRGEVASLEETVKLETVPAPLPVPEEERAALLLRISAVDDEIKTCAGLLEVLDGLMPELPDPRAPADGLVDGKHFVDLVDFAAGRARAVADRRRALEQKRRELDRERRKLDERAGAVPDRTPRVLRGVRFRLDADEDVPFRLEYFVHAARWVPTYALHLATGRARLVTAALVAQATGEDWSGVTVGVCTADLARETTLPVLSSWRIGRAQPAALRAFRPLPTDLPQLFSGYDRAPRKLARNRGGPPPPEPTQPVPRPMPSRRPDTMAAFERADTGEVRSFEEEQTDAGIDLFDDEASAEADEATPARSREAFGASTKTGVGFDVDEAAMSREPPPPPPAPLAQAQGMMVGSAGMPMEMMNAMSPGAPMPPRASMSRGFGGGPMRKRAAREESSAVLRAPAAELPPRLRASSMRMAGPDEPQRGALLPLDATSRLEWLLEAHDTDSAGRAELRRALFALERARQNLERAPLPRGTSALLGTHFPAVMRAADATDVPGDGTFYRVEVREDAGPAATEHKAVPRESNDVWRTCKLEIGGAPLPPGPLAVYEDGAFKVNARLDPGAARVAGAGAVEVNLGVDPDVRVLSRTVHVNQKEKGIVTSTSRVEHKVHLELLSTRKEPAPLVLYDRLPVPADEVKDVTVQVLEEKPPINRTDKDAHGQELKGGFEWRAVLMPGVKHSVDFTYSIDLPAKAELSGGNRRE